MLASLGLICALLTITLPTIRGVLPYPNIARRSRKRFKQLMMRQFRREYNHWSFAKFDKFASDRNALHGIDRLIKINSSQPINEGIFLIYFVGKSEVPRKRSDRWIYHCCIGFKDLYVDKGSLLFSVDRFLIPLKSLNYFINLFFQTIEIESIRMSLKEFLNMANRPYLFTAKIREAKGIEGSCLSDTAMIYCCGCCQMTRELREVRGN